MPNVKKAILQKKIEGVIYDLMIKTSADNVYVDDTTTLAAKLSEMLTEIDAKVEKETGKSLILDTLITKLETLPDNATLTESIADVLEQAQSYTDSAITALGNVFTIKGRKDTVEELPTEGNKVGDVWLVGLEADEQLAEYIWIESGEWEAFGFVTDVDLSDYYTKSQVDGKLAPFTAHVEDETVHMTSEEKSKLAGLNNYDDTQIKADLTAHTSNTGIHVTSEEKTKIAQSGRILAGTSAPGDLTENDLFLQIIE